MALSNPQIEVRSTGNDANGGFWNMLSGTTDYTNQDSPVLALTDVVTNATTTVTSVTGGFTAAMVGSGINIAGTVFEIKTRVDANTITVDRATGTGTGQVGNVGGAVASTGMAGKILADGGAWTGLGRIYTKISAANMTVTTANVSGGRFNTATTPDATNYLRFIAYTTTRGDGGTATVNSAVAAANTIMSLSGAFNIVEGIIVGKTASQTATTGISNAGRNYNCGAVNLNTGFSGGLSINCWETGCTNGFTGNAENCTASGGVTPYAPSVTAQIINCTAQGGTNSLLPGTTNLITVHNCSFNGASGDGIKLANGGAMNVINTIVSNAGGYGINNLGQLVGAGLAFYNNTSGDIATSSSAVLYTTSTSLASTPFIDPANGDFRLTTAARSAIGNSGYPANFTGSNPAAATYMPIGAAGNQNTNAAATSYTLTGDTALTVGRASVYTVAPNGPYTGTITLATTLTGTFSSNTVTFSNSQAPQTVTFTPSAAGSGTISATSSPTLSNPSAISATAVASGDGTTVKNVYVIDKDQYVHVLPNGKTGFSI